MEKRIFVKPCFQNVVASGHICRFVEAADRGVALDCQISRSRSYVSKYPLWEKLNYTGCLIRIPTSRFLPQSLGAANITQ